MVFFPKRCRYGLLYDRHEKHPNEKYILMCHILIFQWYTNQKPDFYICERTTLMRNLISLDATKRKEDIIRSLEKLSMNVSNECIFFCSCWLLNPNWQCKFDCNIHSVALSKCIQSATPFASFLLGHIICIYLEDLPFLSILLSRFFTWRGQIYLRKIQELQLAYFIRNHPLLLIQI